MGFYGLLLGLVGTLSLPVFIQRHELGLQTIVNLFMGYLFLYGLYLLIKNNRPKFPLLILITLAYVGFGLIYALFVNNPSRKLSDFLNLFFISLPALFVFLSYKFEDKIISPVTSNYWQLS